MSPDPIFWPNVVTQQICHNMYSQNQKCSRNLPFVDEAVPATEDMNWENRKKKKKKQTVFKHHYARAKYSMKKMHPSSGF